MKSCAIVLAAGQGKRMGTEIAKQYLLLEDKPILFYSLDVFEKSFIDQIILVVGKDEIEWCRKEIVQKYNFTKVVSIVSGGKERYHSVMNGLDECIDLDYVFIHDGARPFVDEQMLQAVFDEVKEYQACVVGVKVKDTIKVADNAGFIDKTPDRNLVWSVQTPQVFSLEIIKDAYKQLKDKEKELLKEGINITDDAMVVEFFSGLKVKLVEGDYKNIKITTPEDLLIGEKFLKNMT